jgi:oligopeptidase B
VAKLRENTTSSNPIYSLTEIESGHFSTNDRYAHLKKTAFEHAFIVDCLSNDSYIF